MEEILKLLINRESRAKISASLESITQAFKAFQESSKKSRKKGSSSNSEEKDYIHYLSNNYNNSSCWYKHLELINEKFRHRYPTSEMQKAALKDV